MQLSELQAPALFGILALAVEVLANMPPFLAFLLRIGSTFAAIYGALLSCNVGCYFSAILFMVVAVVSFFGAGKRRNYWDWNGRLKSNFKPGVLFLSVVPLSAVERYFIEYSEIDISFSLVALFISCIAFLSFIYLAIQSRYSKAFMISSAALALAVAYIGAFVLSQLAVSRGIQRLTSLTSGLLVLVLWFLRSRKIKLQARNFANEYESTDWQSESDYASYFQDEEIYDESYSHNSGLSDEELVMSLESERIANGYKPGWLFYRCRELGLLEIYERLCAEGRLVRASKQKHETNAGTSEEDVNNQSSDPYKVLNLKAGATPSEIKKAYFEQIKLYHPDKVAALGPELQKLANKMSATITEAYQTLLEQRKNYG